MIDEMLKILKLKKNIILQGASGVGKNYYAAALALAITGDTDIDLNDHEAVMQRYNERLFEFDKDGNITKGRIGFITFNESLDFEKFVEHKELEKDYDSYNNVINDGLFKKIVLEAKFDYTHSFDCRWEALVETIKESPSYHIQVNGVTRYFRCTEDNAISFEINNGYYAYGDPKEIVTIEKNDVEKFWKIYKDKELDSFPYFMSQFGRKENTTKSERLKVEAIHALLQELKTDKYIYAFDRDDYNKSDYEKKKNRVNEISPGIFKKNPANKYVLIIDDINRGNISKIFGETLSLLSAEKRAGEGTPNSIVVPNNTSEMNNLSTDQLLSLLETVATECQSGGIKSSELDTLTAGQLSSLLEAKYQKSNSVFLPYSSTSFSIPPNLYIIATMNPIDRQNAADYALHRKFAFYRIPADKYALEDFYEKNSHELRNSAMEQFRTLKDFIAEHVNRDKGFDEDDLMVGASYFMANSEEELNLKWKFEIIPILKDYIRDGLLNVSVDELIQ